MAAIWVVGQQRRLDRDGIALAQVINQLKQRNHGLGAVGGGINADHRIAAAVEQTVEDRGGDATGIVGRMVGLDARREATRQANGGAKAGHHAALATDGDQVLVPHDFRRGGSHFGSDPGGQGGQDIAGGRIGKQPFAEGAHGEATDGSEGDAIVGVEDQARHFIFLVGDQRFFEEGGQRQIGQAQLGGNPLLGALGGEPGKLVA
jgi:hypothetical protein